ncbi:multiple epidermal growth factor-like domains protein 11, partial [Biomphalaria pfeifferi]
MDAKVSVILLFVIKIATSEPGDSIVSKTAQRNVLVDPVTVLVENVTTAAMALVIHQLVMKEAD